MEAGTEFDNGLFNKETAGLEGGEGRIWTIIHHHDSQSHDLGYGQVTQKSEGNLGGAYELTRKRTCGSKCFEQKFLEFIDSIALSHSILLSSHSIQRSCGQRDAIISMVRQTMLSGSFVSLFLEHIELK